MRFHPFAFVTSMVHLSCCFMGGLLARIHQRVQQRRILSSAPAISTAIPPLTVDLLPTEVETLAVSEAVGESLCSRLPDWIEDPQPGLAPVRSEADPDPDLDPDPAAALDRTQTVIALLDEAYSIGHTTYPTLIAYVQQHTGTGCSRRVVSAWKKTRKLIPAEGKAA